MPYFVVSGEVIAEIVADTPGEARVTMEKILSVCIAHRSKRVPHVKILLDDLVLGPSGQMSDEHWEAMLASVELEEEEPQDIFDELDDFEQSEFEQSEDERPMLGEALDALVVKE